MKGTVLTDPKPVFEGRPQNEGKRFQFNLQTEPGNETIYCYSLLPYAKSPAITKGDRIDLTGFGGHRTKSGRRIMFAFYNFAKNMESN